MPVKLFGHVYGKSSRLTELLDLELYRRLKMRDVVATQLLRPFKGRRLQACGMFVGWAIHAPQHENRLHTWLTKFEAGFPHRTFSAPGAQNASLRLVFRPFAEPTRPGLRVDEHYTSETLDWLYTLVLNRAVALWPAGMLVAASTPKPAELDRIMSQAGRVPVGSILDE